MLVVFSMFPIQGSLIEACQKLLWHVQGDVSSFHAHAERLKGISLYTRGTIGIVMGSYGVGWHGKLWEGETRTVEWEGAAVDEMRRTEGGCGDFSGKEDENCEKAIRSGPNMTIPLHAPVKDIEYAFPAVSFCSANIR